MFGSMDSGVEHQVEGTLNGENGTKFTYTYIYIYIYIYICTEVKLIIWETWSGCSNVYEVM